LLAMIRGDRAVVTTAPRQTPLEIRAVRRKPIVDPEKLPEPLRRHLRDVSPEVREPLGVGNKCGQKPGLFGYSYRECKPMGAPRRRGEGRGKRRKRGPALSAVGFYAKNATKGIDLMSMLNYKEKLSAHMFNRARQAAAKIMSNEV
jgi:hypothetical protein